MSAGGRIAEVECSGETVGEAKWQAVRELERRHPGIDRDRIAFEVISEGQRGLLGVGTTPARVRAQAEVEDAPPAPAEPAGTAAVVRELLERIAGELADSPRVSVEEDAESIRASVSAPASEIGNLIGRAGRTIDAVQQVVSAAVHRLEGDAGRAVDVDAGGYRARRRERLATTARRAAEQALATGREVRLEPMTPAERRIVHTELVDVGGVETHSEGDEPNRAVVVVPTEG